MYRRYVNSVLRFFKFKKKKNAEGIEQWVHLVPIASDDEYEAMVKEGKSPDEIMRACFKVDVLTTETILKRFGKEALEPHVVIP